MASSSSKSSSKRKQQASGAETSESIEAQTRAFLAEGGEIQVINTGVSGQQSVRGPKHISLGNSPRSSS